MKNEILKNLKFTEKEKEACMPLIHKLIGFSIAACEKGLLILEYEIEKETDEFLKEGLQMITDAVNPNAVEKTLQEMINKEQSAGVRQLSQYIAMQGVLLMQNGEPTRKLAAELLSFLDGESASEPDNSDLPDDLRLDTITIRK